MFRYNLSRFIFANFHWTNIQIEIFPLDVDKFLFFFFLEFFSKILQSYDITDCHRQQTDVIHGSQRLLLGMHRLSYYTMFDRT